MKYKAFSFMTTIILLAVLAIIIATMTPIVARKIFNPTKIDSTYTNTYNDRYETYDEEIVE